MTANARVKGPSYTPGEEIGNAVTHGAGALLAAVGIALLVPRASGSVWNLAAAGIYGVSMLLLFSMSALYHAITNVRVKRVLRILDHTSIFLLIAGTYTPFTLVTLRGAAGWAIFGVVWATAVFGVTLNLISVERFRKISMCCYIAGGWCIVFAVLPLIKVLPWQGLLLLFLGGVFYTSGVLFYRRKWARYSHTIWHFFVLAGAAAHYFSVYYYVF